MIAHAISKVKKFRLTYCPLSDSVSENKIQTLQHFSEYSKNIFNPSISALKYISSFTRFFGRATADPGAAQKRLEIGVVKTTLV